jgi:hypothetical protein
MRKILIIGLNFFSLLLHGQTHEKWVSLVNWDGVSHWSKYITYSSRYMGPNALPVPDMGNGSVDTVNSVGAGGFFHFSNGDNVQNLKLSANYCLPHEKISFQLTWIPVEIFHTSLSRKNERKVYYRNFNDKTAGGDIMLNSTVQLLNRMRKHIHLALRLGYRFPSSGAVGAARYTDAPGYYFDLSAARVLPANPNWKLMMMGGFYVWQMNTYGQNDAFLCGVGTEYNNKKWRWQLYSSGYFGWIKNGDDPVVIGTGLERKMKNITCVFGIRQGLHDVIYSTAELGIRINFKPTAK